jgi:four helix bundle protein
MGTRVVVISSGMGDFKELRAWREAKAFIISSHHAISKLPPHERFLLADQWRRAAQSVALNIAEGASRTGPKQFRRYLDIALGSLHELEAILEIVGALEYLAGPDLMDLRKSRSDCARMVYGLLRTMTERSRR